MPSFSFSSASLPTPFSFPSPLSFKSWLTSREGKALSGNKAQYFVHLENFPEDGTLSTYFDFLVASDPKVSYCTLAACALAHATHRGEAFRSDLFDNDRKSNERWSPVVETWLKNANCKLSAQPYSIYSTGLTGACPPASYTHIVALARVILFQAKLPFANIDIDLKIATSPVVLGIARAIEALRKKSFEKTVKMDPAHSSSLAINKYKHTSDVNSMVLSSDGAMLFTASHDGLVRAWDTATFACIRNFKGHTNIVWSLALSNKSLFSSSGDNTIKMWEVQTGDCIRTLKGHKSAVYAVAFGGDRLYSASYDKTIRAWNIYTGECLGTFEGHAGTRMTLSFTCDGNLVSASNDNTVKVWNTKSLTCLSTMKGSTAVASDNGIIYTAFSDNTITAWDASGVCSLTFSGHTDNVRALTLSSDGKILYSASHDKTLKAWDTTSGACLKTFFGHTRFVSSIILSRDNKTLFSASMDKTTRKWNASIGPDFLAVLAFRALPEELRSLASRPGLFPFKHDTSDAFVASYKKVIVEKRIPKEQKTSDKNTKYFGGFVHKEAKSFDFSQFQGCGSQLPKLGFSFGPHAQCVSA